MRPQNSNGREVEHVGEAERDPPPDGVWDRIGFVVQMLRLMGCMLVLPGMAAVGVVVTVIIGLLFYGC